MKWDFSRVEARDEIPSLRKSLHDHFNSQIKRFAQRYQDDFFYTFEIDQDNRIGLFCIQKKKRWANH